MTDVQAAVLEMITKPSLRDLFSYKSRTTKLLLRRILKLADTISEDESVRDHALTAEVWFACIAPIGACQ